MAHEHVCPWWIGYLLASPIRRIFQKPEDILGLYVKEGMRVLEIGPGMGFFSIPMARRVGPSGKIFAIDLQEKMLKGLAGRSKRAGTENIIECRLATSGSLNIGDLAGTMDFTLAFAVVHEVPDRKRLFEEVFRSMKPEGLLLMADPVSRFSGQDFERALELARDSGFAVIDRPAVSRSLSALLKKA